ncbi:MAG: NADH-quinone oxidoreductase subunit B [Chloroflexi bacterium]|nr:NADH-quinone oxidoreductase subunit B [Chloroflexota bacterium]
MEVIHRKGYPTEADLEEGRQIEALKKSVDPVVPDPIEWLTEEPCKNRLFTSIDWIINWARRSALWPVACFPACCAFEVIATESSRFDLSRFGMEFIRPSPRQGDLLITAGTMTWKMAPQIKRIYDQMAEPKWVIAMGACGISGGLFKDSYAVVPGYNKLFPVDVYVPGCPPRPEALIQGIQKLQEKISKERFSKGR